MRSIFQVDVRALLLQLTSPTTSEPILCTPQSLHAALPCHVPLLDYQDMGLTRETPGLDQPQSNT